LEQLNWLGRELKTNDFVPCSISEGPYGLGDATYYSVNVLNVFSLLLKDFCVCSSFSNLVQVAKGVQFPAADWENPENLINVNMVSMQHFAHG
jgi:hypothetical protein